MASRPDAFDAVLPVRPEPPLDGVYRDVQLPCYVDHPLLLSPHQYSEGSSVLLLVLRDREELLQLSLLLPAESELHESREALTRSRTRRSNGCDRSVKGS